LRRIVFLCAALNFSLLALSSSIALCNFFPVSFRPRTGRCSTSDPRAGLVLRLRLLKVSMARHDEARC